MKTIITIQHCQSVHHTNGMVGSWTDWELTGQGHMQARTIAERLKKELGQRPVGIYCSDLKRAVQTAAPIADAFGVAPEMRKELRERNLGACCGHSVQWLREHMSAPECTVDDRLFPDGESRRDAWQRLQPCFDEIMADPCGTVIVISHGDLLSLLNAMFLGLPVESLQRCALQGMAGSVGMFLLKDDGSRVIRRMGDMSYVL